MALALHCQKVKVWFGDSSCAFAKGVLGDGNANLQVEIGGVVICRRVSEALPRQCAKELGCFWLASTMEGIDQRA